jgi:hypothetical protein
MVLNYVKAQIYLFHIIRGNKTFVTHAYEVYKPIAFDSERN